MCYEVLLVFAIVFFASFPFYGAAHVDLAGWGRHAFQAYLFLILGLYFVTFWLRGGQTLPMKTWKLRLVAEGGGAVTPRRAALRYVIAWGSLLAAGAGFLWALVDRERQFLHDRLAGTRIVDA